MENRNPAPDSLAVSILKVLQESGERWTQPMLERTIARLAGAEKKKVAGEIRRLVQSGELAYSYEHGCSFIENSFQRAVRISHRVVVKPPQAACEADAGHLVVTIAPGASFGNGSHPSTRAAVRCLEYGLSDIAATVHTAAPGNVLDIGTGTGILLITALKLGVNEGLGIDRQPVAVAEARENLRHNGLAGRARITDQELDEINERFFLVTANLRYPSLIRFSSKISSLLNEKGRAVLSGMKCDELGPVAKAYTSVGMELIRRAEEVGWTAAVFSKEKAGADGAAPAFK